MADHLRATRAPTGAREPSNRHRRRRDATSWLALGLVVALVLVWTTHGSRPTSAAVTAPKGTPYRSGPADGAAGTRPLGATGAALRHAPRALRPASPQQTARNEHAVTAADRSPASLSSASSKAVAHMPLATPPAAPPLRVSTTGTAAPSDHEVLTGTLSFPADVATTYFETADASIAVNGSWPESVALQLSVACGAATKKTSAEGGAGLQLSGVNGSCRIVLAEPTGATWSATYQLTVKSGPGTG